MLARNEGREIDFLVKSTDGQPDRIIKGRIVRCSDSGQSVQPIIEVDGQWQFSLPGEPRFPALTDDTILKPTLAWKLLADQPAQVEAEVSYITGGMSWEAAYHLVAPEKGDLLELTACVTLENQTGKTSTGSKVQLVAGDLMKLEPKNSPRLAMRSSHADSFGGEAPQVTEKSLDEYHLYSLPTAITLHSREAKQVQFIRASGVKAERIYVYDGLKNPSTRWGNPPMSQIRDNPEYGTESQSKVSVMCEFKNTKANHLGLPLPSGKARFYRQDDDGQPQFVGENTIDHTATDETVRIFTGNSFDLVGERMRGRFDLKLDDKTLDETFEIELRNRKSEVVEVRVVEHLYRWMNWEIRDESSPFLKTDAQTIEFRVTLKPGEERAVRYTVHYAW
jgi:hypothetical protein